MRATLLVLLFCLSTTAEDWARPRGDLGNTGVVKNRGPKAKPSIAWSREEEGSIGCGPALSAGRLYYGVGSYRFACRRSSSGATVWDKEVKQQVVSWPTVAGDFCFFGGQDTVHYRVKLADAGEPESLEAGAGIVAPPAVTGTHYLNGAQDGIFYAMDPETGKQRWRRETGPVLHAPAVVRHRVFVANESGVLHCLDLKRGAPLWKVEAGAEPIAAPIADKKQVYLAIPDKLVVVEAKSGRQAEHRVLAGISCAPALAKTLLHYGTRGGEVVLVDLRDGREKYRLEVAETPVSQPLVLARGILYGVAETRLFAVDAKAGKLLWTYDVEDVFGPPIVADRSIYISAGNVFYCLR